MRHTLLIDKLPRRRLADYKACAIEATDKTLTFDTTLECFQRLLLRHKASSKLMNAVTIAIEKGRCQWCGASWHSSDNCPIGQSTTVDRERRKAKNGGCCGPTVKAET